MRSFFDCDTIPPEPNIFSPGFLPDRTNKYIVKSHSNELNNNQRSQVVWSILNRTRYKNECPEKVGIQRLIAKQVKILKKIRNFFLFFDIFFFFGFFPEFFPFPFFRNFPFFFEFFSNFFSEFFSDIFRIILGV